MLSNEWHKSSRSGSNGQCVEARLAGSHTDVRDSKNPAGPILTFTPNAWRAFVASIKSDDFDL